MSAFGLILNAEARDSRAATLEVRSLDAVIADMAAGHDHDLAEIRGIGQDFDITGHAGIEDDLSQRTPFGSKRAALIYLARFQRQPRLTWTAHRVGLPMGGQGGT